MTGSLSPTSRDSKRQRPGSSSRNLDELIDDLHFERYVERTLPKNGRAASKSLVRQIYYLLRPLFPVGFRKHLQRIALKGWEKKTFPAWPVDFTVDDLFEDAFRYLADALNRADVPFIWYWPDGLKGCCLMTHDVETKAGRDFCGTVMNMEAQYGVRSAFELVPEQRGERPSFLVGDRTGPDDFAEDRVSIRRAGQASDGDHRGARLDADVVPAVGARIEP